MKKMFSILFALLLVASVALAADVAVTRTMDNTVGPSEVLTVEFEIRPGTTAVSDFDLADLIPQTWTITEWSSTGMAKEDITFDSQDQTWRETTYNGNHWKFNKNISSDVTITYTVTAGSDGNYNFVGIWTWPGGFDKSERALTVGTPTDTTTTDTTTTDTTTTDTTTTDTTTTEQPMDYTWIIVGIVIVIIVIGAVYYFSVKK